LADESYPDELRYHREHDWARVEDAEATFGVTWYAQEALGEVVFYEPVKAVSDVYAPLSGEIVAVNDAVAEQPELINQDPYGEGWLVRVKLSDPSEVEQLLDADAYRKLLAEED
jgi:glycine cleavage system H protein